MDKRTKQHRHKGLSSEELADLEPGQASSFDTEAGRAAQGMRPDLGGGGGKANPEQLEGQAESPAQPPPIHIGNPPSDDKPDEEDAAADVT